jgi:hypothetical protein
MAQQALGEESLIGHALAHCRIVETIGKGGLPLFPTTDDPELSVGDRDRVHG